MNTTATVVTTDGKTATVRAFRQSACAGCSGCKDAKEKCHVELVLAELPDSYLTEVKNLIGAKAGDVVEISGDGKFSLFLAFLTFIVPVFAAIIAYIIADTVAEGFVPAMVTGIAFVLVFFVCAFVANGLSAKHSQTLICKIIKENGEQQP